MQCNVGQAVKIGMTIVGSTIGAGFASGREIWEFFGSYGAGSGLAIILSMTLIFIVSVIVLRISWTRNTRDYSEMFRHVMGARMARYLDGFVALYLLTGTLVMLAGSGATFEQWNGSFITGSLVLALAVLAILLFDLRGFMSINALLIPVMSIILITVCVQFLRSGNIEPEWTGGDIPLVPVWPSAIIYAALNLTSLIAVLSVMGSHIRHAAEIWIAGGVSAVCLGIVAYLFNYSLLHVKHLIPQYDIPLFALLRDYSPIATFSVSLMLWLAIYTTAISNIYGLVFRISSWLRVPHFVIGAVIFLLLVPLSQLGFSALVSVLYPLYGMLSLFILVLLLLYPLYPSRNG